MGLDEELARLRPADLDQPLQETLGIVAEGAGENKFAIEDALERRYPGLLMIPNTILQYYLDKGYELERAELLKEGAIIVCYALKRLAEVEQLDLSGLPAWPED